MLTKTHMNKANKIGFSLAGEPVSQVRYVPKTGEQKEEAIDKISENTKKIVRTTTSNRFDVISDGKEYSEYYK